MSSNPLSGDVVIESKDFTTLSSRLLFALNTLGVTQAELSRMIGIKPQAIHYLCNSKSTKSRFTYEIADALKINSLWLATGMGAMLLKEEADVELPESPRRVPILDWKQIETIALQGHQITNIPNQADDWVITNSDVGQHGFAFRLPDMSMYPRFDHDTIVIINPSKKPKNKDFVLAYLEMGGVIFRQYTCEDNQTLLNPINTAMYKIINTSMNDSIIGVMVEARWLC